MQIEKEMLAIVFALEHFNQYTFGRQVLIESDHKPLEAIMLKPLARAPRRLELVMMRLQKYDFTVQMSVAKTCTWPKFCHGLTCPIKANRWTTFNQST